MFLYIGASRSGSTFIYNILNKHSRIVFPFGKPVRFWNRDYVGAHKAATKGSFEHYRKIMLEKYPKNIITGDITDGYTQIDKNRIEFINKNFPNTKVMYCLRNPFDIVRSHLGLKSDVKDEIITVKDLEKKFLCNNCYFPNNLDFANNIKRWREVFGKNFKVYLYEDMKEDQRKTLTYMAEFIGVNGSQIQNLPEENFTKKINERKRSLEFTDEAYDWFHDYIYDTVKETSELLDRNLDEWLEKY